MSSVKIPMSLRSLRASALLSPANRDKATKVAFVTAATIAAAASTSGAQTSGGVFPPVTVEAPAETRQPPRRTTQAPRQVRRTNQGTAPTTANAAPTAGEGAPVPGFDGTNPNAQPGAPYKVNTSGSNKLVKPLADTPRTIVALPKEVIQDKGATSFRELVCTLPGVTLGTAEGGNALGDRVFIRGFDARNDFYVDGVRDSGVATRETFATEQVELTKGPDGTVNGRGTAGGAINIVSKKPVFDNFARIDLTAGFPQNLRVTGDVNGSRGDFAIRGNFMGHLSDTPGRDEVFDNRWGGALALTWKPIETFKATLDYYHLSTDQMPDWGVPFDTVTGLPVPEIGVSRSNYYGMPQSDFYKTSQDILTGTLEWDVTPDFKLTNKTRFGRSMLDYVAHSPGAINYNGAGTADDTVNSTAKSRYQETEVLANLTDFRWNFMTGALKHAATGGLEFSSENSARQGYTGNATCVFNVWNPDPTACPVIAPVRSGSVTTVEVITKSGYLADTVDLMPGLALNGGIRVDDYTLTVVAPTPATFTRHDTMLNWNAGLTYTIAPGLRLYGSYGTSSSPVGLEIDGNGDAYGGISASSQLLGPEKNRGMEIGAKYELFGGRFLVTAAYFATQKDNARETISGTTYDTAAYQVSGFEATVAGKVNDRLSLFGGIVLMDSVITESQTLANIGLPIANIAHQSANLLATYALTEQWTVGGQVTWRGEIKAGTLAAGNNTVPGGFRFDAFADYKINKHLTLRAQVLNIFDEVLYDSLYRSGTPFVNVAPGRSALITASAKF